MFIRQEGGRGQEVNCNRRAMKATGGNYKANNDTNAVIEPT